MFIATSLSANISYFDFGVILIDLFSLFFFQFELFDVYQRHKNKKTQEVQVLKDRFLLFSAFYM